jgi:hypothetical protein
MIMDFPFVLPSHSMTASVIMSHIPDMQSENSTIFIGWLHPDHPYSQGSVLPALTVRLNELSKLWYESVEALGLGISMGIHECEFCGKAWGSGTFGVPSGNYLFFAPQMIAHYVEKHNYAPNSKFIDAVLACPLPGTEEYRVIAAPFRERNTSG